jgi:hypothetical protein
MKLYEKSSFGIEQQSHTHSLYLKCHIISVIYVLNLKNEEIKTTVNVYVESMD